MAYRPYQQQGSIKFDNEEFFTMLWLQDMSALNLINYPDEERLLAAVLNKAADSEIFMPKEFWDKIELWRKAREETPEKFPAMALVIAVKRLLWRAAFNANMAGGGGQITYINPKLRKDNGEPEQEGDAVEV